MLQWKELVRCTDAELDSLGVESVNLACACDLPGAEAINGARCVRFLDQCARAVQRETVRISPQFRRRPDRFNHSWAFFRCVVLVTVLQRDFRVDYNRALLDQPYPWPDSRDVFLHGIVERRLGSCASLPVLYAAVARRLNYPLKLVKAPGHLFCRWEDGQERFNVEASNRGMASPPDNHYRTGMYATYYEEEKELGRLETMTPRDEFADFLVQRGFCRLGSKQEGQAVRSFAWAAQVEGGGIYFSLAMSALFKWSALVQAAVPPGFPPVTLTEWPRVWPSLPECFERDVARTGATESVLRDRELRLALARGTGPRRIAVEGVERALWNL